MGNLRRLCYPAYEMKSSPSSGGLEVMSEVSAAPPTFRERKAQAVREIIWEAAVDLFLQKGYDDTTVDEVAQAAGISPRSFFRYFATKGDLMAHAVVSYADQLIAAIDACPEVYSLSEVFKETVTKVAQDALAQPRTSKVFEVLKKSPAAAAAEMTRLGESQSLVAKAYARRLPAEDELTAAVMAGITLQLTGVTVRWCFEHGQADVSAAIDRLLPALESVFCRRRKAER